MRIIVAAIVSVIIHVVGEHVIGCPSPPPRVVRQDDGTYRREQINFSYGMCVIREGSLEEWTDYPEQGGTFIRTIPARD